MTRTYSPIPNVNAMASLFANAATLDEIESLANSQRTEYRKLHADDQRVVLSVGRARKAALAWGQIFGSLSTAIRNQQADAISDALVQVETTSAPVVVAAPAPTTPVRMRAPMTRREATPEQIAEATAQARAMGQRLAGYSGRVVDPGQGLGTIIAFGYARTEYDPVAGRDRQALISWGAVEALRVSQGLPEKAFGRGPGSIGMLGAATQILNHGGYVARNVRAVQGVKTAWKIGHFDNRIDSDSMGRKEALIQITDDGQITCDDPTHPGARAVIADYERRLAGTMIASDDFQRRATTCLINHYGARSTELGLYVAPWHAARALDLVVAMRPMAGRNVYAWSHTDRESIADALVDSFKGDLVRLEGEIAKGGKMAHVARLERLKSECQGLATILGADALARYKASLEALDAVLTSALDSTSQRAAQLEMD